MIAHLGCSARGEAAEAGRIGRASEAMKGAQLAGWHLVHGRMHMHGRKGARVCPGGGVGGEDDRHVHVVQGGEDDRHVHGG